MKIYIFDKEEDDFMRDEDGEKLHFDEQSKIYPLLKSFEFTDDWIRENFTWCRFAKVLIQEDIPEFAESLSSVPTPSALPTGKLWREVPVSERLPERYAKPFDDYSKTVIGIYDDGSFMLVYFNHINEQWFKFNTGTQDRIVNTPVSWLEPVTDLQPTSVQGEDKTES